MSGVWSKLKAADWTWALYALGASALTYVGATIGLLGAVPGRIPFAGTFATQLAGSFVNRIMPARVGGIATNVRFLQKQGLDLAVASSSIGLQQLSGLLMHITLSLLFLLWAGRSGVGRLRLPALGPDGAHRAHGRSWRSPGCCSCCRRDAACCASACCRSCKRSGQGIGEVARRPLKLAELFGGSALLTLSYIAALVSRVHAFGAAA